MFEAITVPDLKYVAKLPCNEERACLSLGSWLLAGLLLIADKRSWEVPPPINYAVPSGAVYRFGRDRRFTRLIQIWMEAVRVSYQ